MPLTNSSFRYDAAGNIIDAVSSLTGTTAPGEASLVAGVNGVILQAMTVKGASTAAVAADPALVITYGPNSQTPFGTNIIGNTRSFISSPSALSGGLYATVSGYGTLRTSNESHAIFADEFDTTLDTTDRWTTTTVGGGTITIVSSSVKLNCFTTANNAAAISSKPTFEATGLGFKALGMAHQMSGTAPTGVHEFWGFGTAPAVWSATTPLQDAVGFEQDTAGALAAVVYGGGTKIFTAAVTRPTDGLMHRYGIALRADACIWYQDNLELPVASTTYPAPNTTILPIRIHVINGAIVSAAAGSTTMAVGFGDSTGTNVSLSDGRFQWRKATIKPFASSSISLSDSPLLVTTTSDGISGSIAPVQTSVIGGIEKSIVRQARVEAGTVRTTSEMLQFHDSFESTINPWWTQTVTTQTIVAAANSITLNNSAISTLNTASTITNKKLFPIFQRSNLHVRFKARWTNNAAGTNVIGEMGLSTITGITANISNGACFRWRADGTLAAVYASAGTETVVQVLAAGVIATANYYLYDIIVYEDYVKFVMTSSTADIPLVDMVIPFTIITPVFAAASHVPSYARVYVNATGGGTATQLIISEHSVQTIDLDHNKPWADQLTCVGQHSTISPTAFTQTHQLANAAAPGTVTASNTASGYTTLGGEFAAAATASSENVLSLFGFTIPTPYTFYLTRVYIQPPIVLGATIGTRTNLQWFIAYNASSTNLSTATGLIRVPIPGQQAAAAAAAIGAIFSGVQADLQLSSPIACLPGTVLHIGYKCWSGAATASLVFRGAVFVDGYYELCIRNRLIFQVAPKFHISGQILKVL